ETAEVEKLLADPNQKSLRQLESDIRQLGSSLRTERALDFGSPNLEIRLVLEKQLGASKPTPSPAKAPGSQSWAKLFIAASVLIAAGVLLWPAKHWMLARAPVTMEAKSTPSAQGDRLHGIDL